ncbi:unnamed protein product [Cuscuta campestris]|uniref:Uncharacterized protein n=1 Tax=Cuscuta campestris TaxID=132261 RepID=A0A484KJC8_9ASTE|nr:unnamed protein product [Cuscuta campestris]VFQ64586.1 unnamed protein product [Cuscuta campestris]
MLGAIKVLIGSPPSVPNLVSTIIDQNGEAHDHASKKESSVGLQGGDDVDIRHEAINKDNGRSSVVEKKESPVAEDVANVDKPDHTFQEFSTSAGVVIAEYDILKSVDKVTDGDGKQAHSPMLIDTITLFELVIVVKMEHLISPRATTYVLRPVSSFHHFAPRSKMVMNDLLESRSSGDRGDYQMRDIISGRENSSLKKNIKLDTFVVAIRGGDDRACDDRGY